MIMIVDCKVKRTKIGKRGGGAVVTSSDPSGKDDNAIFTTLTFTALSDQI